MSWWLLCFLLVIDPSYALLAGAHIEPLKTVVPTRLHIDTESQPKPFSMNPLICSTNRTGFALRGSVIFFISVTTFLARCVVPEPSLRRRGWKQRTRNAVDQRVA
jgi:hypothetical protein